MLQKANRLRHPAAFQAVYNHKKSLANRHLVCYLLPRSDGGATRFGFSISKKVGKAHTRNQLKRRLNEITRLHLADIRSGYDVIIIVRRPAVALSYAELQKAYLTLLGKGGLYDAPR